MDIRNYGMSGNDVPLTQLIYDRLQICRLRLDSAISATDEKKCSLLH